MSPQDEVRRFLPVLLMRPPLQGLLMELKTAAPVTLFPVGGLQAFQTGLGCRVTLWESGPEQSVLEQLVWEMRAPPLVLLRRPRARSPWGGAPDSLRVYIQKPGTVLSAAFRKETRAGSGLDRGPNFTSIRQQ